MDRELFFERYGLSTWLYVDRSLEEALTKIAGAGFKHVELWADHAHLDPRIGPDVEGIRTLTSQLGLHVHSVHLPFSGMGLGRPDWRLKDAWLQTTGTALSYCAELGAETAIVHVSSAEERARHEQREAGAEISAAFVYDLKTIADRLGVKLALENLLLDCSRCGASLAELARLFPTEGLGFCLDTGHALVNRVDILSELRVAGGRLWAVHAANNNGLQDEHLVLTEGALDWHVMEAALAATGFTGCRMLEVRGAGDADAILAQLSQLWQHI